MKIVAAEQIASVVAFLVLGASLSCIGVLVYDYGAFFGPSELSGQMLQSRFFGALLGSLSAGYFESRWPLRWNLLPMMAMAALSMIFMGLTTEFPTIFLALHFLLGLSTAAILLVLSSQAIQIERLNPSTLLVLKQQTAFGLGAATTPIVLFTGVLPHDNWRSLTLLAALGTCLLLTSLTQGHTQPPEVSTEPAVVKRSISTSLLSYWPLYACIFLYAGLENGLSNWLYSWLRRALAQGPEMADSLLVIAAFWIMVTVGRISVLLLSKRPSFRKSAVGIIATGGIALLAGVLTFNLNQYWLLAAIGILVGPIYPAILSLFSSTSKFHPFTLSLASLSSAAGSIFLAANLGKLIEGVGIIAMPASIGTLAFAIGALLLFQVLHSAESRRGI